MIKVLPVTLEWELKNGLNVFYNHLGVLSQCLHCSLPAQGAEVCSYISCSSVGQLSYVHTRTNRHLLTQDRQDGFSLLQGGSSDYNLRRRR